MIAGCIFSALGRHANRSHRETFGSLRTLAKFNGFGLLATQNEALLCYDSNRGLEMRRFVPSYSDTEGTMPGQTGAPFKPSFGLSGAVARHHRAFLPLVRACGRSIRIRFVRFPRRRLRGGGSCSMANLRGGRTALDSPGWCECNAASIQIAGGCGC